MSYDYYPKTAECEYDEFITKGICTTNPSLSSLQEVILMCLQELAYYVLELKKVGAQNEVIKETIIDSISGIITNIDYDQEQFRNIITLLLQELSQTKTVYATLSKKNNKETVFIKSYFKHINVLNFPEIIKKGEHRFIERNITYTSEQKNLFDILISLIKRLCLKIIQIKSYKKGYEKAYNTILNLLNTLNQQDIDVEKLKKIIELATKEYYDLFKKLYNAQEEAHGKRESVYISFAPKNGKAILVSGIDMVQLEKVLKATQDKNVDVYTHGNIMLMAHTLSGFRKYPNLVGHFGKDSETSLFDFAAFPGAVLMTKYLFQKIEYLYKGKIFTTDKFAPKGIVKIENDNFAPLIQAALTSKGFTKEEQKTILRVGFRQKLMEEKVQEVLEKMENNEIKHLYFIGILYDNHEYKEYFDKFFKILPKDCFAVSLAHEKNEENILHVDSLYDYLLIYKILEKFAEKKALKDLNITIFITKCDQYTLTNVLNFFTMGIKNIFLCKCLPTLISPALAETIKKVFGIYSFSTPEEDLSKTLKIKTENINEQ